MKDYMPPVRDYLGHGEFACVFTTPFERELAALKINLKKVPSEARGRKQAEWEHHVLEQLQGITGIPEPISFLDIAGTYYSLGLYDSGVDEKTAWKGKMYPISFPERYEGALMMEYFPNITPYSDETGLLVQEVPETYFDELEDMLGAVTERGFTFPYDFSSNLFVRDNSPVLLDWAGAEVLPKRGRSERTREEFDALAVLKEDYEFLQEDVNNNES